MEILNMSELMGFMLSNKMAHTVCGQRKKFEESGGTAGVEAPVKSYWGTKESGGGGNTDSVHCGWYKIIRNSASNIKFKRCREAGKPGQSEKLRKQIHELRYGKYFVHFPNPHFLILRIKGLIAQDLCPSLDSLSRY